MRPNATIPPDMTKPILFLLRPSFPDPRVGPGAYYCPHCAAIEGLLAYFPELRERLDIRHVDFARPRREIVAEVGEANQACPVLVLPLGWQAAPATARRAEGRAFFVGAEEIGRFLADWCGIALPHP